MKPVLPLAFALLALTGCFRSRSNEPGPDGGTTYCAPPPGDVCCTPEGPLDFYDGRCPFRCGSGSWQTRSSECPYPTYDGGVPLDGSFPVDAGPLPVCAETRGDFTCLESFTALAERPFVLPVSFDTCGCCAETSCSVAVDRGAQTLRLTTGLCPDPCDCDACITPVAECAVPALPAGEWRVEVNGDDAFFLPVDFEDSLIPPSPACVTYAEPDSCEPSDPLSGRPEPISEVCVRPDFLTGGHVAHLVNDCGTCDREGPCLATVMERLTDDLPPGGDIFLMPMRYFGACDGACPPVCIETTRECPLPELMPGGVYRVFVHGELQYSFTEGSSMECGTPEAG